MLSVADPDDLQCADHFFIDVKALTHRVGKHHIEEVLHVPKVLLRVNDRQSHCCTISISSQSWHLGYEFNRHFLPVSRVEEVVIRVKESRQRAYNTDHNGHRVRFTPKSLVKLNHLLVDHHLASDYFFKLAEFAPRGQLAIKQQIASLHVGGVLSEILYLVSAIEQFSLLSVDVADIGDAASCAHEAWIVGQHICLRKQGTHIDEILTKRTLEDWQLILLVSYLQDCPLLLRLGLDGLYQ